MYVNNTFTIRNSALKSYHIFAGKTRVASRLVMLEKDESGKETEKENGTYYFHGDHLGSSSVITNKSGGFHEHLEYFPYGETWVHEKVSEDAESMPFRFTGKEQDPETDLYYFGARYYDAVVSRWVSADPAFEKYLPNRLDKKQLKKDFDPLRDLPGRGGVYRSFNLDLYMYAHNNPIILLDPDGNVVKKGGYILPYLSGTDIVVSSTFGWRTLGGNREYHSGVDSYPAMARPFRNLVFQVSVAEGIVTKVGKQKNDGKKRGPGNYVEILHGYTKSKKRVVTRYLHLDITYVKEGESVKQDSKIGRVGTTGRSKGPHSHYEILIGGTKIDPYKKKVENLIYYKPNESHNKK